MSFQATRQPEIGMVPASITADAALAEFLAFTVGADVCGIDILCVEEIRSCEDPTCIANATDGVKGVVVLNSHGRLLSTGALQDPMPSLTDAEVPMTCPEPGPVGQTLQWAPCSISDSNGRSLDPGRRHQDLNLRHCTTRSRP